MAKSKKTSTTLDRWMEKKGFRQAVQNEYEELMLSELILAIMAEDTKSIRELARQLGISKTVIQNLRSGAQTDMKLSNFLKFTHAYGYELVLEKAGDRITL